MNDTRGYTVVIEPADDGSFGVSVPDLPGCVSSGDTPEQAEAMIAEAIRDHLALLRERGEPVPPPRSRAAVIDAA